MRMQYNADDYEPCATYEQTHMPFAQKQPSFCIGMTQKNVASCMCTRTFHYESESGVSSPYPYYLFVGAKTRAELAVNKDKQIAHFPFSCDPHQPLWSVVMHEEMSSVEAACDECAQLGYIWYMEHYDSSASRCPAPEKMFEKMSDEHAKHMPNHAPLRMMTTKK